MPLSRRTVLKTAGLAGVGLLVPGCGTIYPGTPIGEIAKGNPLLPGSGTCDPQVRVYDDQVYLYSTHDASLANDNLVMHDWRVWHSTDLVEWEMVSVLYPQQTYFGKSSSQCWATDGARCNDKYYFYFSMGPENIGVVEGPSPAGPWHDPIGKPLIAEGRVNTVSRDPGILQDGDGANYIVFGVWDYYIARLNDDMVSLAEEPQPIDIENPQGPFGEGLTDDKPFLHRRQNKYYLSWGPYYAVSDSPYGPFDCKGSIITPKRTAKEFLGNGWYPLPSPQSPKDPLGYDRHGSFFELNGQWYFVCNDHALPGSSRFFRNSVISYVRYKNNGDIDPIWLTNTGVGQYDASIRIEAPNYFQAVDANVMEAPDGRFQVCRLQNESYLVYPNIRNLLQRPKLSIAASSINPQGVEIDIRRAGPDGAQLAKIVVEPQAYNPGETVCTTTLNGVADTDDLCLVFRGGSGELIRLYHLDFS